ncbi:MAG: excinuclease ABC subunit UvrC [Candidatus Omnitrophica bacterium]|nr:excinuclease ABC subunit UvrC [Candidatus Omnitrophota bacterium]MDD5237230.1 excinuclease ABC subunit UvrC [Candidatus Omnitrophota bacterium]MDD5610803.1 excinuclease ABC subunit UvrC [Candidatus Omnitrophota bacterium]
MDLENKIKALPESSGVYIFKDKAGKILYIGKAANLKKRVSSYFTRYLSDKNQRMVSQAADIEYILTPSEAQAELKEAAMIKDNLPRYNVALKDDKSFPLIRISDEAYPQIAICRRAKKSALDRARYFGPYTNAKLLRQALKTIRRIFGFRSCKRLPRDPCLYYRLNLCPGPCAGHISIPAYREIIANVILFLEGKQETLVKKLAEQMKKLSAEKKYEAAALIRDQVSALASIKKEFSENDFISGLDELMHKLKLPKLPERVEAFDISNISGQEATGSMVSFLKGTPDKNNYRRFRIKTVKGTNDYAMLAEVVRRRYARLKEGGKALPDLILIDGGRQHLLTAERQLLSLGLEIPMISLAKEKEHIYALSRREPLSLPADSKALHLVQHIRDEAHRFALSYHHVLRRKKLIENK